MRIVLGVGGGIAAYKAAELARGLVRQGHEVQAVLTRSAQEFVTPLTMASLTGRKVITGMFESASPEATLSSAVEHIGVAQENDLLLVAPATANLLAEFAHGLAADFLTTLYLAFRGPVILAPAMNTQMWEHAATQATLTTLRQRGHTFVEPDDGFLACGTYGTGRLAAHETILEAVEKAAQTPPPDLRGETILARRRPEQGLLGGMAEVPGSAWSEHAALAVEVAGEADHRAKASAHEMLARIALAKHDADAAREEARLAHEEDPLLPLPDYVEGRLLYDQGKYAEALPPLLQAVAELKMAGAPKVTEVHFYAADTLGRLERYPEAETQFIEELSAFPQNTRARSGLAMLYQASSRPAEAARVVGELTRISPTPDAYALAQKLYTMFGNRKQAEAIRAEARHAFGDRRRSSTSASPRK